jgi:hypothetical protein
MLMRGPGEMWRVPGEICKTLGVEGQAVFLKVPGEKGTI